MVNKRHFSTRFASLFLIGMMVWSTLLPLSLVLAQEGEAPPPPPPVEEPAPPAPEPVPPAPEPTPEVQTVETQTQDLAPNENDGPDGEDGQPEPETAPENGEDGDDQTSTDPAENGGAGDSSAPQDPPAADGTSAEIDTGDASSDSTTTNDANVTDTTLPPPDPNKYPYGKPPAWYIEACKQYPQPHCDKYIVKPPPQVVVVENDLVMDNEGEATSETGENHGVDPDGVSITTGNADSFGYLISLFNVAVTNSSGAILFLKNPLADALDFTQRIMNMFNNLVGADGDCSFLGCSLSDAVLNLITDSAAEVSNELVVRAGTGANSATSTDGLASIDTGNANAFGSIVNFGNLQIVDSRYMIILMSNTGNLNGNIVLPDATFFHSLSAGAKLGEGSTLLMDNTADVTNDGTANALTGSNTGVASSTQEQAQVSTGNANANSSAINFVNQIGSPICFVVNVGGEWKGKVLGLPAGFSREKTDFGELICGAGGNEARAPRGNLHASTTNYAKVLNKAIVEATTGENAAIGAAAKINTGDAQAFVQILNVLNQSIIGQDWIFALFTVAGDWNGNMVFGTVPGQTDIPTVIAGQLLAGAATTGGGGMSGGYTSTPKVTVIKTASVVKATAPAKVDYKIVVKNESGGGALYRAKLADVLKGPDGNRVFARHWNIDTLKDGEEITVTYTVEYNTDIPYGTYHNEAKVTGFRNSSIYVAALPIDPVTGSQDVVIGEDSEVLGVYTGPQCEPLLQSYIKIGKQNNTDDVKDLQSFLNSHEGTNLNVSGFFDSSTINAVKSFQTKYASEVLSPWGIAEPTGHVYYTTQRKINDLYCVDGDTFALSEEQIQEISSFNKKFTEQTPTQEKSSYNFDEVGSAGNEEKVSKQLPRAKVFLEDLRASTSPLKQHAEKNQGVTGFVSWFKVLMPFVDAFEL